MIELKCKQGSPEWFEARRAIPTSSCFSQILTAAGTLSSSWPNYMNKLLAEYIDPKVSVKERVYTKAMARGNEMEPAAREAYEFITGNSVREVGGLWLDDTMQSLCSPDGLIDGQPKGLEIKCPNLSTHIGYCRTGKLPTIYTMQVQAGMAFTDYESWDFMSYHPAYTEMIITVGRDEKLIRTIKKTLAFFIKELNKEKAIIDQTLNQGF
ncbi:MAG: exonuclease [Proteobacteria bacterium]|nr:MAG: exonuclease [Pseudomonadota bacterium]